MLEAGAAGWLVGEEPFKLAEVEPFKLTKVEQFKLTKVEHTTAMAHDGHQTIVTMELDGCQHVAVEEHSEHQYATEVEHNGHQRVATTDKQHVKAVEQCTKVAMDIKCILASLQSFQRKLAFLLQLFCLQSFLNRQFSQQSSL